MMKPGGWIIQFTCCGRDDGTAARATWQEADELREYYVAAPMGSHQRSAIIVAGFEEG
jgi:hypothetical protein